MNFGVKQKFFCNCYLFILSSGSLSVMIYRFLKRLNMLYHHGTMNEYVANYHPAEWNSHSKWQYYPLLRHIFLLIYYIFSLCSLADMKSLEKLTLEMLSCFSDGLPEVITRLHSLKYLDISFCSLRTLPDR